MSKPALIAELERLLQVNLHPIPVAGYDPPLDALRARRNPKKNGWLAQYYLAPDGALAGLNLMNTGLTDAQWAQAAARIDLSRLEALNLRGNELTQVAGLDKMTALRYVDLCENKLKEFLPPPAARLEHVLLTGNPDLNVPPPEVVAQGRWAILGYFEELRRSGEEKSLEAKVILIGEGQAGKTSLRTRLLHPGNPLPHTADRTKGLDIEIEKYNYEILGGETMRLNVFDSADRTTTNPCTNFSIPAIPCTCSSPATATSPTILIFGWIRPNSSDKEVRYCWSTTSSAMCKAPLTAPNTPASTPF